MVQRPPAVLDGNVPRRGQQWRLEQGVEDRLGDILGLRQLLGRPLDPVVQRIR